MSIPAINWPVRLRGRVYSMYARTRWAPGIATAIGAGTQQVDDAGLAAQYLWSIDPITDDADSPAYGIGRGVQLDAIGVLVGQQRGSFNDATYRLILRAKIAADRSHGSGDELLRILAAIYPGATLTLLLGWIAAYTLTIGGVAVDPSNVGVVAALVGRASQAGVYGVLEWQTVEDADCLVCDSEEEAQACGDVTDWSVGGALGGATACT